MEEGIVQSDEISVLSQEIEFMRLIAAFQEQYLVQIDYYGRIERHRHPNEVRQETLRHLNDSIINFQRKEEMQDFDPVRNSHGYATSMIAELFRSDKRLGSLYKATIRYCHLRAKDINTLSPLIAEYRAMNILYKKISRSVNNPKNLKRMPTNFKIERRESDTIPPYLKVYFQAGVDHSTLAAYLKDLDSVRTANVSPQSGGKENLTVYPAKAYDIADTEKEVTEALIAYFAGSPVDPSFKKETRDVLSDKMYFEILDKILIYGKNLEQTIRLTGQLNEETCRDSFVTYLNSISEQFTAKGEVYNRKGKTDILLSDHQGNNIFIAECKLWRGQVYLEEAITQLLERYINWRDEKVALIVFNQSVQDFTSVIDTACEVLRNHQLCVGFLGQRKDTSYSYVFRHPTDASKKIKLELILFNFV